MADDNQIQMEFLINDKSVKTQFAKIEKQAASTSEKINNATDKGGGFENVSKGVDNLSSSLTGLVNPYTAAAAAIGFASKQLFDFAIAGEQANAINIQFANLAKSAGIAADEFADSIIRATEGLIDDEDALQIASQGIIALGENAKKLPQILEISRAASRALGKDFKDTFADMSQFVQTGNARILKNYGIILDLEKAYAAAAKTIGLTSAQLSEQQKQTVRVNLALDELPKKFAAAAQSVTPLKDAFDRLKVSTGNFIEGISSAFAEGAARTFIDNADQSNVAVARLEKMMAEAAKSAFASSQEVSKLSESLKNLRADPRAIVLYAGSISTMENSLRKAREETKLFGQEQGRLQALINKATASGASVARTPEQLKADEAQQKLISDAKKVREDSLTKFLNDQEVLRLQQKTDIFSQKEALEMQHEQNLLNIKTQFSTEKGFSEDQLKAATLAADESYNAQREKINQDYLNTSTAQEDEFQKTSQAGWENLKKVSQDALVNGLANSMVAVGASMRKGEDATQAFADSMIAALGGLAIQIGTMLIAVGLGFSAAGAIMPAWAVAGAGTVAAGLGLVALGGALQAGGGGGVSSVGAGANGAPAGGGSFVSEPIPETDIQQRGASVNVNISGDVFDTEETGLRIVDIISRSFDQNGVTVRGMA